MPMELPEMLTRAGAPSMPRTHFDKAAGDKGTTLNYASLLERVGGDPNLLREIAGIFLNEFPSLMAEIEAAWAAGDALSLRYAAHSMKGSVANFEVPAVTEAALTLELIGRSGDLSHAEEALQVLRFRLESLRPALERIANS